LIGFWDSTAQKPCFILADDLPKYFFNIYLAREILDNSTGPQRSCIWLVTCKLEIIFGLSTSQIFKFYYLSFYWKSSNLKIWRLSKYALTSIKQLIRYELYTLLCAGFLRSVFQFNYAIYEYPMQIRIIIPIAIRKYFCCFAFRGNPSFLSSQENIISNKVGNGFKIKSQTW